MSSSSDNNLIEILNIAGTWILVILGWLVVNDQQETREVAKNMSSRLKELRGHLVDIEDLAIKHHTTNFDQARMREIIRKIGDLSSEVSHMHRLGYASLGTTMDVAEFRKAITGKNMDLSKYSPVSQGSDLVENIANARYALDRDLLFASHKALSTPRTLRESISAALFKRL